MEVNLGDVRKGSEVHSSDGTKLGKVAEVWFGTDPAHSAERCDEDLCSRIEVHQGLLHKTVLYIPYNAIGQISGNTVTLNVDEESVRSKGWTHRPAWIAQGVA